MFSRLLYRIALYPRYFSSLRGVPGPPFGSLLLGHFPDIVRSETGVAQRTWVKQYGPTVRTVGPFGSERLIFLKPDSLHKIFVSDWVDYPRVRTFLPDPLAVAQKVVLS